MKKITDIVNENTDMDRYLYDAFTNDYHNILTDWSTACTTINNHMDAWETNGLGDEIAFLNSVLNTNIYIHVSILGSFIFNFRFEELAHLLRDVVDAVNFTEIYRMTIEFINKYEHLGIICVFELNMLLFNIFRIENDYKTVCDSKKGLMTPTEITQFTILIEYVSNTIDAAISFFKSHSLTDVLNYDIFKLINIYNKGQKRREPRIKGKDYIDIPNVLKILDREKKRITETYSLL
jgi:hypothetical protein